MDVLEHESSAETALRGRTGSSFDDVAQKPPLSLVRNRNPLSVQLVPRCPFQKLLPSFTVVNPVKGASEV